MRYWPLVSVTTDRTFSIRTGLAASTVAPGNTPPEASLTTPVIAAWAEAADGKSNNANATTGYANDTPDYVLHRSSSPVLALHEHPETRRPRPLH